MIHDSLEQGLGIIAACIPTLKPLFHSTRSAKKSSHRLDGELSPHRLLNKPTPSPLLARTVHATAETHQTEIGPKSLIQTGEVGLESSNGRRDNVEAGIVKTVEISHEETVDSVPGPIWFAVSHPQDEGTNFGHA